MAGCVPRSSRRRADNIHTSPAAGPGRPAKERTQCPPRSSFPTTEPPTRTTPSPSADCSARPARQVVARLRPPHQPTARRGDHTRGVLDRGLAAAGRPRCGHATSSPTAPPPRGSPRWPSREERRRDRLLLGLPHRQGPRRRSATPPSVCSKAAGRRSRSRPSTSPRRATLRSGRIVAVGDGDGGARETAEALAARTRCRGRAGRRRGHRPAGDRLASRRRSRVGSRSAPPREHLIEIATCAVLVLPRDVRPAFGSAAAQTLSAA